MYTCSKCGGSYEKLTSRSRQCQPCRSARLNEYRSRTDYHKKAYAKNAVHERERHLIRKYGVTLGDYERMFAKQGGLCAICKRPQDKSFDVDHCHATGRVRGLLCTNCNRMIGHANDDVARLKAAAAYLEAICPEVGAAFIRAVM